MFSNVTLISCGFPGAFLTPLNYPPCARQNLDALAVPGQEDFTMLNTLRRIYADAAGFARNKADALYSQLAGHKKIVGGSAAAAAVAPAIYDKAFEAGRELYSVGRKAVGVQDMVERSDQNSADAKHRRRIVGNARRSAERAMLHGKLPYQPYQA